MNKECKQGLVESITPEATRLHIHVKLNGYISVWRGISKGRRQPVSGPTELQGRQALSLVHSFQILNYTLMQEKAA